jgi:hypothetical protein
MPTKFHAGQRVVHTTLGGGTVIETDGDSCRVELDSDDGARIRTFMISLGTIVPETQASGAAPCASSTVSAVAAETLTTSPPLAAAEVKPAPRPRPQPRAGMVASAAGRVNPSPAPPAENPETYPRRVLPVETQAVPSIAKPGDQTMPDPLLTILDKTLAARGRGAGKALGAELGIDSSSIAYWRQCGKIPDIRRDGVRKWIDTPTITAIRVEKTKPTPKAKNQKMIKSPIKPQFNTGNLRVVEPAVDLPPIRCAVDASKILVAMGLTVTTAWVQEDGIMRARAVVVLS